MPRRGDDPAERARFTELWQLHHGFLVTYALRRLGARDQAEEAVAEAFSAAWMHRSEVPPGADARPWLTRATFHAVSNLQRGSERGGRLTRRLRQERGAADETLWPDTQAAVVERLRAAIEALPPLDRELVRLSSWEQLSHAEIGVVLELSPGNVAVRLHRARARLKEQLQDVRRTEASR